MPLKAAAIVALAAVLTAPALANDSAPEQSTLYAHSGDWYTYMQNDRSDCWVAGKYQKGDFLVLGWAYENRQWIFRVAVGNENWNVKAGQSFNVTVSIDNIFAVNMVATSVSDHSVRMDFEKSYAQYFAQGDGLTVKTSKATLGYQLTGTLQAIRDVTRCTA